MPVFDGAFYPLVLLAFLLLIALSFVFTQQLLLQKIQSVNRELRPGKVWLQLIPLFGMVYSFVVVVGIANSLKKELPNGFEKRPTLLTGLVYNGLFWCASPVGRLLDRWTNIHFMEVYIGMAAFVFLAIYWLQVLHFYQKLRDSKAEPDFNSGGVPL